MSKHSTSLANSVEHRDTAETSEHGIYTCGRHGSTALALHRQPAGSTAFFNPLKKAATARLPRATGRFEIRASSSVKEQAVAGLTAAAMAAAFLVPDFAEAAQPGISPSLKNFLLSIVSGGVVLTANIGAVIGVSNFDPVKRT